MKSRKKYNDEGFVKNSENQGESSKTGTYNNNKFKKKLI